MLTPNAWTAAQRLESWAGEVRVNLIRIVALVAFYGYHLLNVYGLNANDAVLRGEFHLIVTIVVAAWAVAAFVLYLLLTRRRVSPLLPFVAAGWDLVLLTLLLALSDGGPKSPLLAIYFLIVAAAPLRMSLPLVYASTLGAVAGYLVLLWYYVFVEIGSARYYEPAFARERIPRTQEIIFLIALAVAGLLAGQVVRQMRRLVSGYPLVVEGEET